MTSSKLLVRCLSVIQAMQAIAAKR